MKKYLPEMLDALTSAYSRKDYHNTRQGLPPGTNIGKLFSILAWGLDMVQENADLVRLWDDIDHACGFVLDRYGANFGVKRATPDDRIYRLMIKVKVMAQLSGGDTDTVIRAAGALLDVGLPDILLEDVYPAKIALYVDMDLLTEERLELIEPIAYAIKRILAAGVGMRLYLRTYRTYRQELTLLQCGYIEAVIRAVPVGQDRESRQDVLQAHGAFLEPEAISSPPAVKKAHTAHQAGAGGAICHAHIKSKRVD